MEIAQPGWDMINFETRSLTKLIKKKKRSPVEFRLAVIMLKLSSNDNDFTAGQ